MGLIELPASTTESQALWPPHNTSSHYEQLMRRPPVLSGYDLSSEMDPKSHTTITILSGAARTGLLIRQLLIRELAAPPEGRLEQNEKVLTQSSDRVSFGGSQHPSRPRRPHHLQGEVGPRDEEGAGHEAAPVLQAGHAPGQARVPEAHGVLQQKIGKDGMPVFWLFGGIAVDLLQHQRDAATADEHVPLAGVRQRLFRTHGSPSHMPCTLKELMTAFDGMR
ncbi:hypothetical protein AVEN_34611-1 [Araneus ventricosus]|uniref:Uncharacterized protein n=1 Tax=Araneus ventricosus TaxID=182803 RepID=A0A4Y2B032_ARAVE|nr:hypothetical protein AVEN_34611-1 [Araneus ventricosus]